MSAPPPPRTAPSAHAERPPAVKLLTDTGIVLTRELRPTLRDPFTLVFSLVQPLVFLGLFGPLLSGTTGQDTAASLQWFVPGVLVMIVLFGTSATGSNLLYEMMTGSHERMLVTPLRRPALLVGRALKEIAPLIAQSLLIICVTLPFGFRFSPAGAVLGLLILALCGVGVGALSYSLALPLKDREWVFWMVQQTVIFPLLLLSGILLPVDSGPGWIQAVSAVNPLTYVVEAERALLAGNLAAPAVLHGLIAAAATALAGLWIGVRGMRRAKA